MPIKGAWQKGIAKSKKKKNGNGYEKGKRKLGAL